MPCVDKFIYLCAVHAGSSAEEVIQVHLSLPYLLVLQPRAGLLATHRARADRGHDALSAGGPPPAAPEDCSRCTGVGCGQEAGDAGVTDQGQSEHGSCV